MYYVTNNYVFIVRVPKRSNVNYLMIITNFNLSKLRMRISSYMATYVVNNFCGHMHTHSAYISMCMHITLIL